MRVRLRGQALENVSGDKRGNSGSEGQRKARDPVQTAAGAEVPLPFPNPHTPTLPLLFIARARSLPPATAIATTPARALGPHSRIMKHHWG